MWKFHKPEEYSKQILVSNIYCSKLCGEMIFFKTVCMVTIWCLWFYMCGDPPREIVTHNVGRSRTLTTSHLPTPWKIPIAPWKPLQGDNFLGEVWINVLMAISLWSEGYITSKYSWSITRTLEEVHLLKYNPPNITPPSNLKHWHRK